MKPVIENPLSFLVNKRKNEEMLCSFNHLLDAITSSKDLDELKKNVATSLPYKHVKYFDVGFGSNHMWMHQSELEGEYNINSGKRILIVNF
jgi:hypothetical protein